METTLMYLTGNDSRLAQDLISALSILFLSFFSVEMEDEHETESINPIQSTDGTSGEGVPGLCPPVNDGSGPLQPGKHPEAVCLRERALSLGWPEEHIRIIDGDLGISGSGRSRRPGFAQLVTSVSLGEVGAVFGLEISRLARSSADLMKLLELCSRARISNSFAVSSTTCLSTRTNRCSRQKYKSPI